MADMSKPKERRSPSQNSPRAESGSPASPPAGEWGTPPAKPGVRGEVKLALMLVMTLAGAFGYIVYRKFDALQQVAAAESVEQLKFKPVEGPGLTKPQEVDLSGLPEQSSEPLFAAASPSTGTSDPFMSSATAREDTSTTPQSSLPAAQSSGNEPRTLNIQTATLVTAVEERPSPASADAAPWSPAPERVQDVPLGLFQPEPVEPRSVETNVAASPQAFPQTFPQTPPVQSEPAATIEREPAFSPEPTRASPAEVPFQPLFTDSTTSGTSRDATVVSSQPGPTVPSTVISITEEPLPFATAEAERPSAVQESLTPPAVRPEASSPPLWTPIGETPVAAHSAAANGSIFAPAEPETPRTTTVPFTPQAFPSESTAGGRTPSGHSLTDAIAMRTPTWSPEPSPARSFSQPAIAGNEQVYTIRPGDNYWSISRNLYGTSRYFDALTEYNRDHIPDPSRMQPGSQLLAPTREVLEAKYPQLCGVTATPARLAASSSPAAVERGQFTVGPGGQPLYRVGQGDTLTSIAQKHLGRASRWTQVYEMNQDVLPNADTLKPGTVLKLPLDASQVAVTPEAAAIR